MQPTNSTTRRLDRWDGLILAAATAAMLGLFLLPEPGPAAIPAPVMPPPVLPPPIVPVPGEPAPVAIPVASNSAMVLVSEEVRKAPQTLESLGIVIDVSILFLTGWTAAIWIIRMRRPRARWRRLIRQPGLAASSVGLVVFAVVLAGHFIRWAAVWGWTLIQPARATAPAPSGNFTLLLPSRTLLQDALFSIESGLDQGWIAMGWAVAATWLIMALGGWWRPEKSAIDRMGRALGMAWIAVEVVISLGYLLDFGFVLL